MKVIKTEKAKADELIIALKGNIGQIEYILESLPLDEDPHLVPSNILANLIWCRKALENIVEDYEQEEPQPQPQEELRGVHLAWHNTNKTILTLTAFDASDYQISDTILLTYDELWQKMIRIQPLYVPLMTKEEMIRRVEAGEDPISISIDHYRRNIRALKAGQTLHHTDWTTSTCALCYAANKELQCVMGCHVCLLAQFEGKHCGEEGSVWSRMWDDEPTHKPKSIQAVQDVLDTLIAIQEVQVVNKWLKESDMK